MKIPRRTYADLYGPTTGDRVRLGDTALILEIERDFARYGEEVVFGGGKVVRDGQGQSQTSRGEGAPDLVITNAIVLDHWGIVKADIGVRDGRIVAIGKAGNPDVQDGVTPGLEIGPSTEIIAGEHRILTAGGIDSHVHFISPQQAWEALYSGVTTMIGGGTGPAEGTRATTCTPGEWNVHRMLEAAEGLPLNFGFLGKGNASRHEPLVEQVLAGAIGLKLHEDWGTTPAAIDAALTVADEYDVQVAIHTDTLNESGFLEDTLAAIAGRTIHTYHSEGAGGGHAPDILKICGQPNVLPSSTNPTMPYTANTLDEHLDMLMVCHHLNPQVPEDVAFAESRIRPETMAAEDVLHDLGAISMMSSDSQAMGRVGEVITRTWQTAHVMKETRGALAGDTAAHDNLRIRRYVAKYTINPAIAHGVSDHVGSIEVGEAGRHGGLVAGVLRRQAGPHHQRGHDRRGADGRSERVDSDARTGAVPPDVRCARARAEFAGRHVRVARVARRGEASFCPAPVASAGTEHAHREQAEHDPERRASEHRDRSRALHRHRRWRADSAQPGITAAAGAAVFSVLGEVHGPGDNSR